MRNFEQLRHRFFARTIAKNVMREPEWRSRLNLGWFSWAISKSRSVHVKKGMFDSPEGNPLSQRYIEHTFDLQTHPGGVLPWLVELARISVPSGHVCVLKSFEQFARHVGLQSTDEYSVSGAWGNPYTLPTGVTIRWFFRLENNESGVEPTQINVVNPTQWDYPGEPHYDIGSTDHIWFPAASPTSQNFHLLIGGGLRLRILARVELVAPFDLDISAKVRGYRMSSYDPSSLLAIRSLW